MDHSAGGSSTSPTPPSRNSRRSEPGSSRSASTGSGGLGAGALRDLAARHGIRPSKALGQNFLVDPNTARLIASLASPGPDDRVLEIGPGLGSLTVALAETGAEVLAVEFDRSLVPALTEVVGGRPNVTIRNDDAMKADWRQFLPGAGWKMVSNLPYNIATPLVLRMLEEGAPIDVYVVMVQREVGERLAASPGEDAYGAVSVKVAYRAETEIVRRTPPSVFWPRPKVGSVLLRIRPLDRPRVATDPALLFRIVEEGFAQRRKTMANALRRLGSTAAGATAALSRCGLPPNARAEDLSLEEFARLAEEVGATDA